MLFLNYITLSNLSNYIQFKNLVIDHYQEFRWLAKEHMDYFICLVQETYEGFVEVLSIERNLFSLNSIVKEIQFEVYLLIDKLKQVNSCLNPEKSSIFSQDVNISLFQWERRFIFNKIRDFINIVCQYLDFICKLDTNQLINFQILFYVNWFIYYIKFVYKFVINGIALINFILFCLSFVISDLDLAKPERVICFLNACIHYIKMVYNFFIFALFCIIFIKFFYTFCINLYFRKRGLYKNYRKIFSAKKFYITSIFLKNNIIYHLIFYKQFLNKLFSIREKKTFYLINNIAFNRAIFMKILAQKLFCKSKSKVIKNIKIIKLNFIKNLKYNLKEYILFYHLGIKISAFFFNFHSILFINGSIQKKIINKNDYLNYILQLFLSKFYNKYNSYKLVLGITKNNFQKLNKMYKNQSINTFFLLSNVSISNSLKLLKIKAKILNHYYSNIQIKVEALNCSLFLSLKCFRYLFTLSNAFNMLTYAYKKYIFIFFQKVTTNVLLVFLNTLKILVTIYLELIKKYSFICILMFNILKRIIKTILYFFLKFIFTNILTYCLIKNVEKILYYMLIKCIFKKKIFSLNSNILFFLHFSLNENEKLLHFEVLLKKKHCFLFDFYKICLYIYKIWLNFKSKYFQKFFKKLTNYLANIRLYNKFSKTKKALKIYAFSKLYIYYIFKNYNFKFRNKLIFSLKFIERFICCLKLNMFQTYIIKNKLLGIKKFFKQNFEFFNKNNLKLANNQTFLSKITFITSKNIFNLVLNFKQTSKAILNVKHMYFNFNCKVNIYTSKNYNLFLIKKILQKYILGQDNVIRFLLNLLKFSCLENSARFANRNVLLFYGLKNVGKTQAVKALSISLFNSTKYLSIYNMFYYMNKLSIKFLIHEYYNIPKFLFTKNKNNLILVLKKICSSIIYLKNIEKAHPYLLNILINILKTGFFRDINNYKIYLKGNFLIFSLKYHYLGVFKNRINIQRLKSRKYHKRLNLQRKLYKKNFLATILIKFLAKMHQICKIAIFKILLKIIKIKIFNSFLLQFANYLMVKNIKLNVENNVIAKIICSNKLKAISLKFLVMIIIIKPILVKLFKYSLIRNITVLLKKKIKIIYTT